MKVFRGNVWWSTIVPQVLGWIYFCLLVIELQPQFFSSTRFVLFFVSLISLAGFGYALNDFFDRESDAVAGKKNLLVQYSQNVALVFVLAPLVIGIVSWVLFNANLPANVLLVFQVIVLATYSIPPFRFKERGIYGVLADAFYAHINPVFIVLLSFGFFPVEGKWKFFFVVSLLPVLLLKGVRNILIHQVEDRKFDAKANGGTLVNQTGGLWAVYFLNKLLVAEILFSALLVAFLCFLLPPMVVFVLAFIVVTYLKFSGWKLAYLPSRQLKFKFLYFMNDLYECWMPFAFLVMLTTRDVRFIGLLLAHHILFPAFVVKLIADAKKIRENFKTEEVY